MACHRPATSIYAALKERLIDRLGVRVQLTTVADMRGTCANMTSGGASSFCPRRWTIPTGSFSWVHWVSRA